MSNSFDDNIASKVTIRDGQSLWYNEKKKISNSAAKPINSANSHIKGVCFPYAIEHIGADLCKDLDDDPLHTSLPSGTYYGVTYTHNDNCLSAKYPMLAASIKPIAQYHIRKTYTVTNQVLETLIIDAVGNMLAVGWKMYGIALEAARRRSGYKTVDEDDLLIGSLLFDNFYEEHGEIDNSSDYDPVKTDSSYNKSDQDSLINYLDGTWGSVSQSQFDNKINAHLSNAFMSNTIKGIVQLMFGNVIKARYADADTSRYYVFGVDEMSRFGDDADFDAYVSQIKQWDEQHARVILNRYSFMPELLHDIGVYRIDTTLVVGQPNSGKDRIVINKAGNTVSVIYDETDVFKNIIDHNAITSDVIHAYLAGDSDSGTFKNQAYDDLMFTEADSYLNNELEIGDHILMNDSVLSVLLHNGLRLYNAVFIDISKLGNADNPTITKSVTMPVPCQLSAAQINISSYDIGLVSAQNALFNTTKLIDPTWTCIYGTAVSGVYVQSAEIKTGINTYAAPSDELHDINTYAVYGILLEPKVVVNSNSVLRANPDKNNNSR